MLRKETTIIDSNLNVSCTYEGTEILSIDKLFELSGNLPIDIALTSNDGTDIRITLIRALKPRDRAIGQIVAKFTEREPTL